MADQYEFFGGFPPHQPRDTSVAAAAEIKESASTLRREVYACIKSRGSIGATDDEIQEALGMAGNTQRPRRRELESAGVIAALPGIKRETRSGRKAQVWVAK